MTERRRRAWYESGASDPVHPVDGHNNGYLSALQANRMIHTLGEEEISHLLSLGQWVIFEQDETVCRQTTPIDEVLFLVEGRAKADVSTPKSGTFATVLNLLKPGDDIGLLSLVDGAPHSATVTSLEPLRVLSIPVSSMRETLRIHPEWYQVLAEAAVSRLRTISLWLQALM